MPKITSEQLSNYFGDDDYWQLLEYILNILNNKVDVKTCKEEVLSYD